MKALTGSNYACRIVFYKVCDDAAVPIIGLLGRYLVSI